MTDNIKKDIILLDAFKDPEKIRKLGIALFAPIKEALDKKYFKDEIARYLPPRILKF